jgi:chromosomal replication initiator protein
MNEMVFSLKNNRIEAFKDRYRRLCDVLLLEEVHFLSGKEKTQAELGYTLDALINDKKKVIFTSSLPPKNIPRMSKALSSRLTSGLITTIDTPDYETRVKILLRKSAEQGLIISEEIICFLAGSLRHDVRQMESVLNCLKARAEFLNAKIDVGLAKDVVRSLVSDRPSVTLEQIKELIVKYYKIEADMLSSKSRKKIYAYPRNIYIYLCRCHTSEPLEKIAKTVNRSHSAVIYASELVEHKMETDARMKRQVELLSRKVEEMKNDRSSLNAF